MKLSIIIPIYNVERYVEKCILSCLNQDLSKEEYEIICINDGTPDESGIIAETIAKDHSNIKVVNQENYGLSSARNNGLKLAKGEYVWFVDSDDWIEQNCLKEICDCLDGKLDILQLQRRLTYEDATNNKDLPIISIKGIPSGPEVLMHYRLPTPAQFRIYRRKFLIENKLWFYKGILHEDSEFMPRALYSAKSVTSFDDIVYNYYQRTSGNIMSTFKIKNVGDLITVNNSLYEFSDAIESKVKKEFNRLIGMNLNSILFGYSLLSDDSKKETRHLLRLNRHLIMRMLYSGKVAYMLEGALLLINIRLAVWLYSMIKKTQK